MSMQDAGKESLDGLIPLVVCPHENITKELQEAWPDGNGAMPGFQLNAYPHPEDISTLIDLHKPSLCILDAVTQTSHALAILQAAVRSHPEVPVLSIHSASDSDGILRFIRQGAVDFLVQPVQASQLIAVLEKIRTSRTNPSASSRAEVCCVVPAKGACGASTLAAGMAWAWKKRGAKEMLLADLDPLTGSLGFLLKLKPAWSFVDAMLRGQDLDSDMWSGLVYQTNGVDVLLAPDKPDPSLEDLGSATPLLRFVRSLYDHVVLDTAGAAGAWPISVARDSDHIVLVATTDPASVHAAQRVLATWRQNMVDPRKAKLVLNRYQKGVGLAPAKIEEMLQIPVAQLVPCDYGATHQAMMAGESVSPSSSIGRALTSLIDQIDKGRGMPSKADTAKPSGKSSGKSSGGPLAQLLGLFGRR